MTDRRALDKWLQSSGELLDTYPPRRPDQPTIPEPVPSDRCDDEET